MSRNDWLNLKRALAIVAIGMYGSIASAHGWHKKRPHTVCVKHHAKRRARIASARKRPKHVIFFDLDDTPSASQIEPLSLAGQQRKSASEIATGRTSSEQQAHRGLRHTPHRFNFTAHEMYAAHLDPNFGTAKDGRESAIANRTPASNDAQPARLSARELFRIQRSMRRKTSEALADYD